MERLTCQNGVFAVVNGSRTIEAYKPGKPPKAVTESNALEKAEKRTRRSLIRHISKMEELAKGVYVVGPTHKGKSPRQIIARDLETGEEELIGYGIEVYQTTPSRQALEYLIDRGMGKVPSKQEITGPEGGALQIIPWAAVSQLPSGQDVIEGEKVDLDGGT